MAVSLVVRGGLKVITDYTGVVQFRVSGELGGAYWTFNLSSGREAVVAAHR